MLTYHRSDPVEDMAELPPLRDTPGYRIVRGNPRASLRFDMGGSDKQLRLGIWRCTEGAFECIEAGDELQTVISGRLRLIESDGTAHEFGPGDSIFTRKGERVVWDVIEEVTKVFFTYNRDGK
ncbi:MAG: cupin domain-containing protein [Ardenticatenaceae bacterium]